MAQFDVHVNTMSDSHASVPYLLNVQADVLEDLGTRVVVPLVIPFSMGRIARILNPRFKVEGEVVVMSTAELAGIPVRLLGEKVGSLKDHREEIVAALDFLLTGF